MKDDYSKFSRFTLKDLAVVHDILESACHASMQNRLEAETEHQQMISDKSFNAMVPHKLARKT